MALLHKNDMQGFLRFNVTEQVRPKEVSTGKDYFLFLWNECQFHVSTNVGSDFVREWCLPGITPIRNTLAYMGELVNVTTQNLTVPKLNICLRRPLSLVGTPWGWKYKMYV